MDKKNTFKQMYTPINIGNGIATLFTGMRSRLASTYRMFFMTSVVMISASSAGWIGSVVSFLGLISTVLWGIIMQKSNPKMGRIRFWVLVGGVSCGICCFLSFVNPGLTGTALVIYLLITCSGMDVFYNAFYPASVGVISLIANDSQERTAMTSVKQTFNSLAKIVYGAVNVGIIAFGTKLLNSEAGGYATLGLFVGGLTCIGSIILSIFVKGKEQTGAQAQEETAEKKKSLPILTMLKLMFSKPMLFMILGMAGKAMAYTMVPMMMKYYYTYVAPSKNGYTFFLTFSAIFLMVGMNIVPHISKRIGAKKTVLLGYIIYAICLVIAYVANTNATVVTIALTFAEFSSSLYMICEMAVFLDTVDYVELSNKVDAKGFLLSLYCLVGPFMQMVCSSLVGAGLTMAGFDANNILPSAQNGIRILLCLVPVVFFAISFLFYKLSPVNDAAIAALKEQE